MDNQGNGPGRESATLRSMNGHRGRKVHVVEVDGTAHNAYSTSIDFSLTLDDLTHAIAVAATREVRADRRFQGRLGHNPIVGESFWSEHDLAAARAVASDIGPGITYHTARVELRAHGESWRSDPWDAEFPAEVARHRAEELFPMLRNEGNPFAPAPPVSDRGPLRR